MCVIAIKPKGVEMPDIVTLKMMRRANPDGFGFVSETKYYKTTNFADFMRHLRGVDDNEACVIHFRWATHGSVKKANCHPFCDDNTGVFFAHNGVLPIESKKDKTDSEICFRERFVPIIDKYGLESVQLKKAVMDIIGTSRFVFMKGKKVKSFGTFYKVDGVLYSNLRWQYTGIYR